MKKLFYISLISTSLLIFSCQKETNIGHGILPKNDLTDINITDTFSIQVHTIKADSTVTGNVNKFLLGEYNDPLFGHTKAGFVLQFSMATPYVNFKDTDIVDSVILTLPYNQDDNNVYGNSAKAQNIKVYRFDVDLDNSNTYYANEDTSDFKGEETGGILDFIPNPTDTLLKIRLNNSLGEDFIVADESNYSSTEDFHTFFNGLFITSESDNGDASIVKFDNNEDLRLSIYFHKNDGTGDSYTYQVIGNNIVNARFNIINHIYTTANFAGPIDDETLPQDSVAYIQSGGGLLARIQIPDLKNFSDSNNIVINKAELIIPTAPNSDSYESSYPAINNAYITGYITDNSSLLIPDYITSSSYKYETYSDNIYKFNITSYVQNLIDGTTENNGINIYPVSNGSDVSRSVITTGNNSNPVKLVVTYTKFN